MALGSSWTPAEDHRNAMEIMRGNIRRDPVGRQLTPEAQERAVEFAVSVWKGQMGNGQASQIGIKHVSEGVLRDK